MTSHCCNQMVGFERLLGKRAEGGLHIADYDEKRTILGTIQAFYFLDGTPIAILQEDTGNLMMVRISRLKVIEQQGLK